MNRDFEWLKTLKAGNEVAVDCSSMWNKNFFKILKVEKITPSGRIKLSDGSQYQSSGREIGESYSYPLRQITPEIMDFIERRNLLYKINDFDNWKGLLSRGQLETLLQWKTELNRTDGK